MKSQYSYYLGLLNKRKNTMFKTAKEAITSYQDEMSITRYGVALLSHHFDEEHNDDMRIILYFKRVKN